MDWARGMHRNPKTGAGSDGRWGLGALCARELAWWIIKPLRNVKEIVGTVCDKGQIGGRVRIGFQDPHAFCTAEQGLANFPF